MKIRTAEEIKKYIKLTGVKYDDNTSYQMTQSDVEGLFQVSEEDAIEALFLAFDYGRAKGERHARREAAKKA